MSAVNLSSINAVLGANGVLKSFVGSSEMILLALTATIFSFSIALIPFIASRIVRGDVGSTMLALVGTMAAAGSAVARLAAASFAGLGEGAQAARSAGADASSAPPAPPPPTARGGSELASSAPMPIGGSSSDAGVAAAAFPSTSPRPMMTSGTDGAGGDTFSASGATSASPTSSSSRPGQYRGFNIPHAVAWHVGYSLGSAYRGMRGKE